MCAECGHSNQIEGCLCPGNPNNLRVCRCSLRIVTIYWRETDTYATEIPLNQLTAALKVPPAVALERVRARHEDVATWLSTEPGVTTLTQVGRAEVEQVDVE